MGLKTAVGKIITGAPLEYQRMSPWQLNKLLDDDQCGLMCLKKLESAPWLDIFVYNCHFIGKKKLLLIKYTVSFYSWYQFFVWNQRLLTKPRFLFCCDLIQNRSVSFQEVQKVLAAGGSAVKLGASIWTKKKPLLPCCQKMKNLARKTISWSGH